MAIAVASLAFASSALGVAVGNSPIARTPFAAQTAAPVMPRSEATDRDIDAIALQGQWALDRFDRTIGTSSPNAIAFTGELTAQSGPWEDPDADAKRAALKDGALESAFEFPEPELTGEVVWRDGRSRSVELISALDAISEIRQEGRSSECDACFILHVTNAELVTRRYETSRGMADTPTWALTLAESRVVLYRAAVADRLSVPGWPDPSPTILRAVGEPADRAVSVVFKGTPESAEHPCGADYASDAFESDHAIVVVVHTARSNDTSDGSCGSVQRERSVVASLARPIGLRTIVDPYTALPVPLYAP